MAFFDNIGQRITQTGQSTIQKTKDMAEVARINALISGQEKQLENSFNRLGRTYYAQHTGDAEEGYVEIITAIKSAESKIDEYKRQIRDIKGMVCCEKCGAEVAVGARFCISCGAPMPEPKATAPSSCANCGAPIPVGAVFCTSCGKPVAKPAQAEDATQEDNIDRELTSDGE